MGNHTTAGGKEMERDFRFGRIQLIQGDITREATDAIVNAANPTLLGGGGGGGGGGRDPPRRRAGNPCRVQGDPGEPGGVSARRGGVDDRWEASRPVCDSRRRSDLEGRGPGGAGDPRLLLPELPSSRRGEWGAGDRLPLDQHGGIRIPGRDGRARVPVDRRDIPADGGTRGRAGPVG